MKDKWVYGEVYGIDEEDARIRATESGGNDYLEFDDMEEILEDE